MVGVWVWYIQTWETARGKIEGTGCVGFRDQRTMGQSDTFSLVPLIGWWYTRMWLEIRSKRYGKEEKELHVGHAKLKCHQKVLGDRPGYKSVAHVDEVIQTKTLPLLSLRIVQGVCLGYTTTHHHLTSTCNITSKARKQLSPHDMQNIYISLYPKEIYSPQSDLLPKVICWM